jgi:NADP-dependent aldehyde dehydrogenase
MGAGQFCTKPGLILVPAGHGFAASIAEAPSRVPAVPLLSAGIAAAFARCVGEFDPHATPLAQRAPRPCAAH